MFAPSNQRGNRIKNDFQAVFQEAGGEVLDWYGYEPALQDFSAPVASLLNVTRSRERHRQLAASLGVPVQIPRGSTARRRRHDLRRGQPVLVGRSLASQLRFFGAGNIPMYATAEIYDLANTGRDNDLNGFIIADTPALLLPDADASAVRAGLETYWPQRTPYLRFYDMGFDAYSLIARLYSNDGAPWSLRGLSGDLSLDAQGRVRRVLPLAQFRNGRPVALDTSRPQPIDSRGLIGLR